MAAPKPIYCFSYASPPRILRHGGKKAAVLDRAAHMLRDGDAQQFIANALNGFQVYDVIPNYPPVTFDAKPPASPSVPRNALILQVTRPPISDAVDDKRRIDRSRTELEKHIFAALGLFLERCSRLEVKVLEGVAVRAGIAEAPLYYEFSQYRTGNCIRRGWSASTVEPVDPGRSVGFLVYCPSLYEASDGPGLLVAFGMSGVATLAWSMHLRAESERRGRLSLPAILRRGRPRLVAAEFAIAPLASVPSTLRSLIAGQEPPRVLLDIEL